MCAVAFPAPAQPTPTPIPLGDLSAQVAAAQLKLSDLAGELRDDNLLWSVQSALPPLTQEIDMRLREDARLLQSRPDLEALQSLEGNWRALELPLPNWKKSLALRVSQLDSEIAFLDSGQTQWQSALSDAKSAQLPPEIPESIRGLLSAVEKMRTDLKERRAMVLTQQNLVNVQDARIQEGLGFLAAARNQTVSQLLVKDCPPLWSSEQLERFQGGQILGELIQTFEQQLEALGSYFGRQSGRLILQVFVWLFLAFLLGRLRIQARQLSLDDPARDRVRGVLRHPLATALLLAVPLARWFDPSPPRLFVAGLGAVALVPALSVLRRLLEPALLPLLNVLFLFYLTDQLRAVAAPVALLARLLLIAEMLAALLFLAFYSRRFIGSAPRGALVDIGLKSVGAVLFGSAMAALLGYYALAMLLSRSLLGGAYSAVILYGALKVLDALFALSLRTRPLNLLNMTSSHRPELRRHFRRFLSTFAGLLWILKVLDLLSIRDSLLLSLSDGLSSPFGIGSLQLTLGRLIGFVVMTWLAVKLSRMVRFVLDQEIFPRLSLSRGAPYALGMAVHYTILVIGVLGAMAVLGVDGTRFTVVAGALSVGIGFGLQNIVNNFVSGLILLVDRPISVGDTIKIGDFQGKLRYVGLRSSILVIGDGSEVIIPNSELINQRVLNWSASGQYRRVDLKVPVATTADPEQVVAVLMRATKDCPGLKSEPAAQTLMLGFGATSLDFQVQVWVEDGHTSDQVRSDLARRVNAALAEAGLKPTTTPPAS